MLSSREVKDSGGTKLETLHKRGRWRILEGPLILGDAPAMYHQCIKTTTEEPDQAMHPVAFTNQINIGGDVNTSGWALWIKAKPKWRCRKCGKTPPDSIITTFTLLTYDETTKEVARVTSDYHNVDDDPWWCEK